MLAALGVPIGSCVYWIFEGGAHSLQGVSLGSAALYTVGYSLSAAVVATLLALPVALLVVRHPGRVHALFERTTFLVLAMPGVVVALAISYFSEHYGDSFGYQSAPLLVLAYGLMFFPLALVCVRASVAQSPVSSEEVAGSLGVRRLRALGRVTLPLVAPGVGAALCLVFLSAATELTATLILIPTNAETLATQFWAYQQNLSYGQAAPFALMMIAIAAVPSYVLSRFFDRLPRPRSGPATAGRDVTDLEVTGIHKAYGDQPVLRGLDLVVAAGSFTSILGPSGSGKTTLLRLIAGFERADGGVVRLGDEVVDGPDCYVAPDRRRIGFVPQDGSLFPHLSVEHNVGFGLPRRERRGRRVAELIDMAGPRRPGTAVSPPALRRPAAAGRPRPGARHRALARAARRALRLPRREPPDRACAKTCGACSNERARRRCSSPTTRTRPSRSPIESPCCATGGSASTAPPRTSTRGRRPRIDPIALLRAAAQFVRAGHIVSGGSTIAMQAARPCSNRAPARCAPS